jgi:hypothetical protein
MEPSTCPQPPFGEIHGTCTVPMEDARLSYADALEDWKDAMRDMDLGAGAEESLATLDRAYARLQRLVNCPCVGAA